MGVHHRGYAANWHPVTWLSHMLDASLFGASASAAHVVNLALHIANTLFLFLLLRRLTRAFWPSAVVAALFAVHPLHVESVAWIAERKDVLSTFWWLITIWLYARYVERRGPGRYALVLGGFAIALMAKPMVVALPFVLLLLDYWPLGRLSGPDGAQVQLERARRGDSTADRAQSRRHAARNRESLPTPHPPSLTPISITIEKLPLIALAALSSTITFLVQRSAGAMNDSATVPFSLRAQNAVVSYVRYARDMAWPQGLAVFYPFPRAVPIDAVVAALVVLLVVTAAAVALWRRAPYVIVGWLWYLGTLVPVIGLVQVGAQARADRYTYVPLVGLFIATVWSASALLSRRPAAARSAIAAAAMAAVLLPLAVLTHMQVQHWRDATSLWQRAATVVTDNYRADASLGLLYLEGGDTAQALAHLQRAIRVEPDFVDAQRNAALLFAERGQPVDALPYFREVVRLTPNSSRAHSDLGSALAQMGRLAEAIPELQRGVDLDPTSAVAACDLGSALAQADRAAEAIPYFQTALRLDPNYETAHMNLAMVLAHLGRFDEADGEFVAVIRINPSNAQAQQAHRDLAARHAVGGS